MTALAFGCGLRRVGCFLGRGVGFVGLGDPAATEIKQRRQEIADVEIFQPAHDCAACRAGNDQAKAFLTEHPDKYVALANLSYTEVWP